MLNFLHNQSDKTAVCFQDGSLSYAQLNALLCRGVAELENLGLSAGDRVGTILPNSLELLVCYCACLLRGVIVVPVNNRLTVAEADVILEHARPQCLITTREMRTKREQANGYDPDQVVIWENVHRWLDDGNVLPPAPLPEWPEEKPAILFYTSGSTGQPKGVVYSWRTLSETSRLFGQGLSITERDRSVVCHCFSHNFMFSQLTVPFLDAGGAVHIVDFGSVDQTADALRGGATFICLIPWLGYLLLDHFRQNEPNQLKLRACLVGGDRVPLDFFPRFNEIFGVMPAELLGMTETNTYVVNPLVEGDLRLGSVGTPLPESQIEIRDPDCRPVPTEKTGEIWVKTPMAMAGYWQNPEQTRLTMRDGWVATGDGGYLDEDGYLWFTGRIKHMIICDGDNIYPGEVENIVGSHPAVSQACVVGVPHETRGETVAAAVTLENPANGLTLEELQEFLADRLAETKTPQKLIVLDSLPQTTNGKLDRKAIAALMRG